MRTVKLSEAYSTARPSPLLNAELFHVKSVLQLDEVKGENKTIQLSETSDGQQRRRRG